MDIFNLFATATRPEQATIKLPAITKIQLSEFHGKRDHHTECEFELNGFGYCVLFDAIYDSSRYNSIEIAILEIARCPIAYKEYLTMNSISTTDFQTISIICENHFIKTTDMPEWLYNERQSNLEYQKNIGNDRY